MNILFLNYEFPPIGGGASNASYNIAKQLVLLGNEVHVLTSKWQDQPTEEYVSGVKVYRVESLRQSIHACGMKGACTYIFNAIGRLQSLLKENDYDIIHCFFSLPTGLLTLLSINAWKVPYIVSLRGSDVPGYDPFNRNLQVFHSLLKPVTKIIWKRAKKVIALSQGLKDIAVLTMPFQDIGVIGNGVDSELFNLSDRRDKDGKFRLICVSRLIHRKGIHHIIRALAEIKDPNIHLQIVGKGNHEENLKEIVKDLRLDSQVDFYGYCSQEKLSQQYNLSDCFILPSMAESFGIVFAEAMACGLPIIAGRTGGVPEMLKEDNGILVEPGNVREIKNAIKKLQSCPELSEKMRIANRKKVLEQYSWQSVAKKYCSVYKESLA